jgi:hypothetical protein
MTNANIDDPAPSPSRLLSRERIVCSTETMVGSVCVCVSRSEKFRPICLHNSSKKLRKNKKKILTDI